jgi:hypothetical protein
MEFAIPQSPCSTLLLRATLINSSSCDVELDTLTLIDSLVLPLHCSTSPPSFAENLTDYDYSSASFRFKCFISVEFMSIFILYGHSFLSLGPALLLFSLLVPATACLLDTIREFFTCSCAYPGSWDVVALHGWQSFSYCGLLAVSRCRSAFGVLRRLLWRTGLMPLQPGVLTGWAFSGAFHDGEPKARQNAVKILGPGRGPSGMEGSTESCNAPNLF